MTLHDRFRSALDTEGNVVLATVVAGPEGVGAKLLYLDGQEPDGALPAGLAPLVVADAQRALEDERPTTREYETDAGHFEVFYDTYPSPPQVIIVGASHAAGPLSVLAKTLGYRVTICDARAAFAVADRFPAADAVLKGWPQDVLPGIRLDANTYVVLLSHDARFDTPTLEIALPSRVRYIGAIGSRKTQRERFERLREAGYTEEQLARVHGPVGLDLGGRSAEETALAILAEMTAVRYGASGGFLRDRKA
jgi:xanthine dehydrogenase accessory factor